MVNAQRVFHDHAADYNAEHFARPTTDFSDLATAVISMLHVVSFPPPSQLSLEGT